MKTFLQVIAFFCVIFCLQSKASSQVTYPCGVYFLSMDGTSDIGAFDKVYVTGDYTLSAWVQTRDSVWQGKEMDIFYKQYSFYGNNEKLDLYLSNEGELKFSAYILKNGVPTFDSVGTGIKPSPFIWYHIAVAFNQTGNCTIYVNGNAVASKSFGGPMSIIYPYSDLLTIGGKSGSYGSANNYQIPTFKGYIDEIAVAAKALNQEQIRTLANGLQKGNAFLTDNLVYSYNKEDNYPNNVNTGVGAGQVPVVGTLHTCPVVNKPPVANAGVDQTIFLPDSTATLTGNSTDEDGTITLVTWSKVSGPDGESITDPNSNTTTVTDLQEGKYVFKLTATDDKGATGTDDVTIVVRPKTEYDTLYKCPGVYTDISTIINPSDYLNVSWTTWDGLKIIDPAKVDTGKYRLVTTPDNSIFDTTFIYVKNHPKPDLGPDTTQVFCPATFINEYNTPMIFDTTGYSVIGWFTLSGIPVDPTQVPFEEVHLIVKNEFGCFDTASVAPVAFPVHNILPAQPQTCIANRQQPDGFDPSWTNYYYDYKDSVGSSHSYLLLSLKKGNQDIGTIGDGTFQVKVVATSQAGSGTAIRLTNSNITNPEPFAMNRYWSVTVAKEPHDAVGVRYYYNNKDFDDLKTSIPRLTDANSREENESLYFYVVHGGNPDPNSNFDGVTPDELMSGDEAQLDTYVYSNLECGEHQVEFLVDEFSGGGGGATVNGFTLPIILKNFTAVIQNHNTVISWQTTQEINTAFFNIERSTDGVHFTTIAKVNAAGNSSLQKEYSFIDVQALKGTNFYRLKMVDKDNKFNYSKIVAVRMDMTDNTFKIFPNPANNILNVQASPDNNFATLQIIDVTGRKLKEEKISLNGNSWFSINIKDLPKGVYNLLLKSKNKNEHQKFVKQ